MEKYILDNTIATRRTKELFEKTIYQLQELDYCQSAKTATQALKDCIDYINEMEEEIKLDEMIEDYEIYARLLTLKDHGYKFYLGEGVYSSFIGEKCQSFLFFSNSYTEIAIERGELYMDDVARDCFEWHFSPDLDEDEEDKETEIERQYEEESQNVHGWASGPLSIKEVLDEMYNKNIEELTCLDTIFEPGSMLNLKED